MAWPWAQLSWITPSIVRRFYAGLLLKICLGMNFDGFSIESCKFYVVFFIVENKYFVIFLNIILYILYYRRNINIQYKRNFNINNFFLYKNQ